MTPDHWNRICFALEGIELQLKRIGEVLEKPKDEIYTAKMEVPLGTCESEQSSGSLHSEDMHHMCCLGGWAWEPKT